MRVHRHAPAIDAFASLTLAEQPYGANGRRYTLTNAGKVEVVVWTFSAMRAGNGPLAFDTGEMSNLEPGEAVTKYLVYHPGKTHPWGQYRLVVVAVEYRRWGDIVTQSRTRAGRKVDALERALEAKMKAFAATFGK